LPLDYALTLTPEPDTGAKHDSWGGDCSGVPANSPCSGTMSVDRSVSASFSLGGCGNGVLNPGEQCDNGPNNGACPRTCSNSCTINSCPVCTPGDVTCSGSLRLQCDSSGNWQTVEDCNNRDGGYCIGNVRETRDYGCSLGSCTYTLSSTEDCSTKTSVDSDGSPTAYDVAGTVTDYTTCASSACNSNPFSDYCLLKSVFE